MAHCKDEEEEEGKGHRRGRKEGENEQFGGGRGEEENDHVLVRRYAKKRGRNGPNNFERRRKPRRKIAPGRAAQKDSFSPFPRSRRAVGRSQKCTQKKKKSGEEGGEKMAHGPRVRKINRRTKRKGGREREHFFLCADGIGGKDWRGARGDFKNTGERRGERRCGNRGNMSLGTEARVGEGRRGGVGGRKRKRKISEWGIMIHSARLFSTVAALFSLLFLSSLVVIFHFPRDGNLLYSSFRECQGTGREGWLRT